jgi:hypothetical protein
MLELVRQLHFLSYAIAGVSDTGQMARGGEMEKERAAKYGRPLPRFTNALLYSD